MKAERSEAAIGEPDALEAALAPNTTVHEPYGPSVPPDADAVLRDLPSEFDSIEEVDAVARSLRRVALEYGALFLALLLAVPLLSWLAPPWFTRPLWGGLTLNFLAVALLLYIVFVVIALAYTRFAEHVEDGMLGRREVEEGDDA